MIASLTALLLAWVVHGDHLVLADATKNDRIAALARMARAGDVAVAGLAEEKREPKAVVDVEAAGCSVAFKTATSSARFRAHIADFSRDLAVIRVSATEVQVIDRGHSATDFTLRSRRAGTVLHNELVAIQEACRAANVLF